MGNLFRTAIIVKELVKWWTRDATPRRLQLSEHTCYGCFSCSRVPLGIGYAQHIKHGEILPDALAHISAQHIASSGFGQLPYLESAEFIF
ncbi:MAG: hypothetical protein P8123_10385, partial [bacterium]